LHGMQTSEWKFTVNLFLQAEAIWDYSLWWMNAFKSQPTNDFCNNFSACCKNWEGY
jgi:hypothetical protein